MNFLDCKGRNRVYVKFSSGIARAAGQPWSIVHQARMILPVLRFWRSLYATHIFSSQALFPQLFVAACWQAEHLAACVRKEVL